MRRFGWQISGISVAVAAVVVLGLLAFGCGSGTKVVGTPVAKVTARPTPTVDGRVADVEAAARRYVEALEASAKTGDASAVDALVVAGSQAEGNAGILADFSRENHYNFIAGRVDYDPSSWQVSVGGATATAVFQFELFGHNADWPSLRAREADHESHSVQMNLEFQLEDGKWLVAHTG